MRTFTPLKSRIVWADGDITFTPEQLYDYILRGGMITEGIHVNALNFEVENFNQLNPSLAVNIKESLKVLDQTWNIPDEYKNINIGKYVTEKLKEALDKQEFSASEIEERIKRVEYELSKYKEMGMSIVLKTVIYILDEFKKNNVVWGTGRGSSCSSYVLHIMGLHNVDSVALKLDVNEFFN